MSNAKKNTRSDTSARQLNELRESPSDVEGAEDGDGGLIAGRWSLVHCCPSQ
jgi:hypothetical protein